MSDFNPETFLNTTVDGALDTKIVPCPVGEYMALADKVTIEKWAARDGSSSGLKVKIMWEILDDSAKEVTGRDTLKVKQEQMLDLTDTGQLDMAKGKNVGLGRLREALDLNKAGEPFAFSMIQGRMATVKVSHRVSGEDVYDEIKAVAKAS